MPETEECLRCLKNAAVFHLSRAQQMVIGAGQLAGAEVPLGGLLACLPACFLPDAQCLLRFLPYSARLDSGQCRRFAKHDGGCMSVVEGLYISSEMHILSLAACQSIQ